MAVEKSGYDFKCDHPHCTATANYKGNILTAISKARENGWAVSKDRKVCWCKLHADMHRNVGGTFANLSF